MFLANHIHYVYRRFVVPLAVRDHLRPDWIGRCDQVQDVLRDHLSDPFTSVVWVAVVPEIPDHYAVGIWDDAVPIESTESYRSDLDWPWDVLQNTVSLVQRVPWFGGCQGLGQQATCLEWS